MRTETESWWGAALGASIVTILVLVVGLAAVGGWAWTAQFLAGAAASWAQAVGTVVAIVYSGRIARTQISASRRWDERKRIEAERRHLATVVALLAAPLSLCAILRNGWDQKTGQVPLGFDEKYWKEARIAIAAIDPFSCPDEDLVVHLVQVPRQLDDLIHAWEMYRKGLRFGVQVSASAEDLSDLLDQSIEFLEVTANQAAHGAMKRAQTLHRMSE